MKKLLIGICLLGSISYSFACSTEVKRNPDGTYVIGGASAEIKRNPDGTYVIGGASTEINRDGSFTMSTSVPCHTLNP